ncbi:YegP family protein [Pseudoxanthomonas sp. CF125]|uniref:YegP family protein n=1 Tax=Pseudoxanthomonas sp. CF125 TaxID=1855303 RepID=UPI0008818B68|nr:YegP family protein [Pseudoxanthomonas sp. CF125]SDQ76571.1 hypothetical protein SAMN05216569_1965 [Pseudoxanthomonas sp. CF125]
MGTYVLKNSGAQFHFTLEAENGKTILSSERYTTKANALGGIQSVKENSPFDVRYERKDASNGSPMFNLKSGNGQVIGTSETYSSAAAREGGIASVKTNGSTSPTRDDT